MNGVGLCIHVSDDPQWAAHIEHARLLFDGAKATGVVFEWKGRTCTAKAGGEILLCAGSIMSPVILKRSGVGPAKELKESGIDVVMDHPEVGENLMDHMEIHVQQRCTQPVTLSRHTSLFGQG